MEENSLAIDAPPVAGEMAVVADDTMAGDGDGDTVSGAGPGDGAHGFRTADFSGDLRVARGRAGGDFPQCLPDALLEHRPSNIKRQVEAELRRFHETGDLGGEFLVTSFATDEFGFLETVPQVR